ncbi:unnamed protein product [Urochloa humidicola]
MARAWTEDQSIVTAELNAGNYFFRYSMASSCFFRYIMAGSCSASPGPRTRAYCAVLPNSMLLWKPSEFHTEREGSASVWSCCLLAYAYWNK